MDPLLSQRSNNNGAYALCILYWYIGILGHYFVQFGTPGKELRALSATCEGDPRMRLFTKRTWGSAAVDLSLRLMM